MTAGMNVRASWDSLSLGLGSLFIIDVGTMMVMPWITPPDVTFAVRISPDHLLNPVIGRVHRRYVIRIVGLAIVVAIIGL